MSAGMRWKGSRCRRLPSRAVISVLLSELEVAMKATSAWPLGPRLMTVAAAATWPHVCVSGLRVCLRSNIVKGPDITPTAPYHKGTMRTHLKLGLQRRTPLTQHGVRVQVVLERLGLSSKALPHHGQGPDRDTGRQEAGCQVPECTIPWLMPPRWPGRSPPAERCNRPRSLGSQIDPPPA